MFKGLIQSLTKSKPSQTHTAPQPTIIPRADHSISRNHINRNALKVLYRLHNEGYSAYLVGGCVRDILLGRQPKDFDIATDALPEEVRRLFKNCRLIGKRFRLAHILFGKDIIEVATFRTHHHEASTQHGSTHQGMIVRDNVYGSIEDDVWRRDFTVNALYYNIADFSIVDYMDGMNDVQNHLLRIIGDPEQRFHEDPVRLLRAVRFAGKLNLTIHPDVENALLTLNHLLGHVSPARLFQEVLKFFQEGPRYDTFKLLLKYEVFGELFPQTARFLQQQETIKLIEASLKNTDERDSLGKTISPTFLFAVFLWRPILHRVQEYLYEDLPAHMAHEKAIRAVLREQTERLTIPKRLLMSVYDICFLQYRLSCRHGTTPHRLLEHPRFRASYDLLILRNHAGEPLSELSSWWTSFIAADLEQREELIKSVVAEKSPKKKKRNTRKRRKPRKKPHIPSE